MADTKTSATTELAGGTVASDDKFPVADTSATETKHVTRDGLIVMCIAQGLVKFQVGEPADGTLNNNEAYLYLDNTASPQTLHVKVKDNSGVVFTANL
jgi:hypothetical protein